MQSWRPWCEHQHVKLVADEAQGLESLLSVVFSRVFANERGAPLQAECKTERNTPLGYVSCVLGRIEGYEHVIYCTHINEHAASAAPKTPNPSLKRSANGMSRWPSSAGPAAHCALAVQRAMPSSPA